ncbi:MAG: 16S rRNA (cytosine(1402)-N(4))-methyltransferase RsmH [Deltaproteobacteria bacterium]|nr:16S rRNA (cytosine(1402)-N(4))-methyltransferase RsmH [Deltaproteobacteria bacterium]
MTPAFSHLSVMPLETIEYLACVQGGVYVDCTVGGGGHAALILEAVGPSGLLIGIDRDDDAIESAKTTLSSFEGNVKFVKANFNGLRAALDSLGIEKVDGVLFDLGVSSYQFDSPERGFSFRLNGRLDMRMDKTQALSAFEIVNEYEEADIERILREYGEERHSRRIARAIARARAGGNIETTGALAEIASRCYPARWNRAERIDPATRTFQALRIAVNGELEAIRPAIVAAVASLKIHGRCVVISFHSLEDRIVKEAFKEFALACVCPPRSPVCVCGKRASARIITKKPVRPLEVEVFANPRARSAKLRAVERI